MEAVLLRSARMSASVIKPIRFPAELHAAALQRMAELELEEFGAYVRSLVARDCGLEPPSMGVGLAGANAKTRMRVSKAGVKGKAKAAKRKP